MDVGPNLADARQRLERLARLDLAWRALSPDSASSHWAEAWRQAQANLRQFEVQMRATAATAGRRLPPPPRLPESFRAVLLTNYCASLLRFQAALNLKSAESASAAPAEWAQLAAAAAILSALRQTLLLWVMQRPPACLAAARPRRARASACPAPLRPLAAARAICLPLRL